MKFFLLKNLKLHTLILLLIGGFMGFSQDNFNLPPGFKFKSKFEFIDYSGKFLDVATASKAIVSSQSFLKNFSSDDLSEMKLNCPEKYRYYMDANTVYENLSPRVKNVFTVDELWFIYMFDVELAKKLRSIK